MVVAAASVGSAPDEDRGETAACAMVAPTFFLTKAANGLMALFLESSGAGTLEVTNETASVTAASFSAATVEAFSVALARASAGTEERDEEAAFNTLLDCKEEESIAAVTAFKPTRSSCSYSDSCSSSRALGRLRSTTCTPAGVENAGASLRGIVAAARFRGVDLTGAGVGEGEDGAASERSSLPAARRCVGGESAGGGVRGTSWVGTGGVLGAALRFTVVRIAAAEAARGTGRPAGDNALGPDRGSGVARVGVLLPVPPVREAERGRVVRASATIRTGDARSSSELPDPDDCRFVRDE
jgi:hypothetical protein